MKRARLLLGSASRRHLEAVAATAGLEERCGILLGRSLGPGRRLVTAIVDVDNATAGDPRHEYAIHPRDLLKAWRRARRAGERIVGFYHSHPDGSCRPSVRDASQAWPDASYVIVAPGAIGSWSRRGGGGPLESEQLCEAGACEGAT